MSGWPFDTGETVAILLALPFFVREIITPWSHK